MNAQAAFDLGAFGQGVTIAFIDSGIDLAGAEFAGRILEASRSFPTTYRRCAFGCPDETVTYPLQDIRGAGTAFASVAAAAADGQRIVGVAPSANILMLKAVTADVSQTFQGDTRPVPESQQGINLDVVPQTIRYALDQGAFVINISATGPSSAALQLDLTASLERLAADNRLLVLPIGAEGSVASSSIAGNFAGANGQFRQQLLLGVQVDADLRPQASSGTPGTLADRTLAVMAFGTGVVLPGDRFEPSAAGNNIAGAAISGAAALLKSRWPQLGGRQIASIMLDTARDLGDPGTDQTFGRGLLDIRAALAMQQPMALGLDRQPVALEGTRLLGGGALGGGWGALGTALGAVEALDRWGRDWAPDLGQGVAAAGLQPRLHRRLHLAPLEFRPANDLFGRLDAEARLVSRQPVLHHERRGQFAFQPAPGLIASGDIGGSMARGWARLALDELAADVSGQSLALGWAGVEASFSMGRHEDGPETRAVRHVSLALGPGSRLGLGTLDERGSVLGARGFGALALPGARTLFLSAGQTLAIGPLRLSGDLVHGSTRADPSPLLALDRIDSLAWSASADLPLWGGRLTLGVDAPLAARRAPGRLMISRYDRLADALAGEIGLLALAPEAREREHSLSWSGRLGRIDLGAGLSHAVDAGHFAGREVTSGWVAARRRF